MSRVGRYYKAIVGFLAPGAVLLIAGSDNGWSQKELGVALLTCVVTAAGVAAVPGPKPQQ